MGTAGACDAWGIGFSPKEIIANNPDFSTISSNPALSDSPPYMHEDCSASLAILRLLQIRPSGIERRLTLLLSFALLESAGDKLRKSLHDCTESQELHFEMQP